MTAILELRTSDPTDTISLLGGPIYLSAWDPVIAQQKSGGIYLDSPLKDGRTLVGKARENAVERFDVKITGHTHNLAAMYTRNLLALLEHASTYWTSNRRTGKLVYIASKSSTSSEIQYATIMNASVPGLSNPYAMPFLQPDSKALENNVSLVIERSDWEDSPPGQYTAFKSNDIVLPVNRVNDGSFDTGLATLWVELGAVDVSIVEDTIPDDDGFSGVNVMNVVRNSASWGGMRQDVATLEGGSYTITCRVRVISGSARLIVYDYGGILNGQSDTSSPGADWQTLSVTRAPASGGLRVSVQVFNAGSEANFTAVSISKNAGQVIPDQTGYRIVVPWRNVSGITHIYAYDSTLTSYSDRLDSQTLPYGLWQETSSPAVGDIIYFGSATPALYGGILGFGTETVGSVFGSLAFNLETGAVPVGSEKLTNTTFETDTTGWSLTTASRTSGSAHGGSWKIEIATSGSSDSGDIVTSSYSTVSGNQALFSVWARPEFSTSYLDSTFTSGWSATTTLKVHWYDATPTLISTDQVSFTQASLWSGTDTTYKQMSITGNKPPGATQCKVQVEYYWTNLGIIPPTWPRFYYDDVSLTEPSTDYVATWQYYNGSWTDIPNVIDKTNGLQNTGTNIVQFTAVMEDNLALTVNGVFGYWVRLYLSSISGGSLINAEASNFKPFVPNASYIEIDGDEIGGELPANLLISVKDATAPDPTEFSSYAALEDAHADDSSTFSTVASPIQSGNVAGALYTMGVIFDNVSVPDNATILDARLVTTPNTYNHSTTPYKVTVQYEVDADPAVWTNYTDYSGRTLSDNSASWWISKRLWESNVGGPFKSPNIAELIEEVINQTSWVSGNNMGFRLSSFGATNDYITSRSLENNAANWGLEIDYVVDYNKKTALIAGSRSVSRGSNFTPYIGMRYSKQPYIRITSRTDSGVWGASRSSHHLMSVNPTIDPSLFVGGLADIVKIEILYPLSTEYSGGFKAYARVSSDSGATLTTWRLAYKAGNTSPYIYNRPVGAAKFYDLVDLGSVSIPSTDEFDELEFVIQADVDQVYITDFILMPADEWFGEFLSGSITGRGGFSAGSELRIGDMTDPFSRPRAILFEEGTNRRIGQFITYAQRPTAQPGETVRMWFMPLVDLTLRGTAAKTLAERSAANPESTKVSYPEHTLYVNVGGKRRYSGKRGDG